MKFKAITYYPKVELYIFYNKPVIDLIGLFSDPVEPSGLSVDKLQFKVEAYPVVYF